MAKSARAIPDAPASTGAITAVQMDPAAAPLRPEQRLFNRLVADIEKARKGLADWIVLEDLLQARIHDGLVPALDALKQARRALALAIDGLLSQPQRPTISNQRRRAMLDVLDHLIDQLTEGGVDAELEAVYDRHHAETLAQRREVEDRLHRQVLERVARARFGEEFDLGNDDPASLAERMAAAEAQQAGAEQGEAQTRRGEAPGAPRSGKQAQRAQDITQSLREVYRKLASSLHPDREPDPAERARKTELMQQVNRAYEARDLLSLLRLQMAAEQISGERLVALPAALVKHYNEVLKEQLSALRIELRARVAELSTRIFGDGGRLQREPKAYVGALEREIREIRDHARSLTDTVQGLSSKTLRAAMQQRILAMAAALQSERAPHFDEIDDIVDLDWLDQEPEAPARRGRRHRR